MCVIKKFILFSKKKKRKFVIRRANKTNTETYGGELLHSATARICETLKQLSSQHFRTGSECAHMLR